MFRFMTILLSHANDVFVWDNAELDTLPSIINKSPDSLCNARGWFPDYTCMVCKGQCSLPEQILPGVPENQGGHGPHVAPSAGAGLSVHCTPSRQAKSRQPSVSSSQYLPS